MFDIGWQELFILAVLAIIVVGPKDLPKAVGTITKWIRKARSMARDLQDGLDEVAREAELDDLKKELDRPGGLDLAKRIEEAVDPTGEITADMDLDKDVYDEMSDAMDDLKDATDPGKSNKAGKAEEKGDGGGKAEAKAESSSGAESADATPKAAQKANG
ncbi:MAG: Sec-independent protein translocase protein TatB [Rhodospirillales bacterium]